LPGWRLEWLILEDAVALYLGGLNCPGCKIRVSCGCDVVGDVLAGRCPHGTAKAVQAAARRCGYLEATA
jgi:hypothetical protein